jgi:hypothetical protein
LADLASSLKTKGTVEALDLRLDIPPRFLTVLKRKLGVDQREHVRLVDVAAVSVSDAHGLMAESKTMPTDASVEDDVASRAHAQQRVAALNRGALAGPPGRPYADARVPGAHGRRAPLHPVP